MALKKVGDQLLIDVESVLCVVIGGPNHGEIHFKGAAAPAKVQTHEDVNALKAWIAKHEEAPTRSGASVKGVNVR